MTNAHIIDARGVYIETIEIDPMGPQPAGAVYADLPTVVEGYTRIWSAGQWQHIADSEVPAMPAPDPAEIAATVARKIDALWASADAYTSRYISGVAIGLLTIGVLQAKPKAQAVSAWSSAVWDDYYARKALVTVSSVENLDFSNHGPMPYSVPELRAEMGM